MDLSLLFASLRDDSSVAWISTRLIVAGTTRYRLSSASFRNRCATESFSFGFFHNDSHLADSESTSCDVPHRIS